MKRFIFASLLVISFSALGQADTSTNSTTTTTSDATSTTQTTDISGSYMCNGTNPDGKAYQNTSLTVSKNNQVYSFSWSNSQFGQYMGTGISANDSVNAVAAYFAKSDSSKSGMGPKMGVVVYTPSTDGNTLQGSFAFQNGTALGTETCTKNQASNS